MHEKHRDRLRDKAIENMNNIFDHELLELLLFNAKPRVNTNDTAHILLHEFGSLENVFNASYDELISLKGVGKSTATFIISVQEIFKRCYHHGQMPEQVSSLNVIRDDLFRTYAKYKTEVIIIYYLDQYMQVIGKEFMGDHFIDMASIDMQDFCKKIVLNAPKYLVITHNHLSGDPRPSRADIATTEKLCYILSANNIKLLDHIIIAHDKLFSFFHESVLDDITARVEKAFEEK